MLLALEVCDGADENSDILTGAANHGVTEVAQQLAHLARLVIVVDDELLLSCPADGAFAILPREHSVVVLDGDAVFGFKVYTSDPLRIFARIPAALFQTTQLAYRLYTIEASPVSVEL